MTDRTGPRDRPPPVRLAIAVALVALLPAAAVAQDATITKVEEDWELVIGEPEPENNSPQVFIVTTPTGNLDTAYSVFEINNLSLPDYFGGGLQLQSWYGEDNTGMVHHDSLRSLATTGETITFTVQMRLFENRIRFKIKDGVSTTWGTFGGDSMSLSYPSSLQSLAAYSPDKSAEHSRVGFSGNRVKTLTLKQVRYYSGNDLTKTDQLDKVVHDSSVLAAE